MSLPNPSNEQMKTVRSIQSGNNVLLDCCAGSGKTTTNMFIAKNCQDMKILILTYNKKLKFETRDRVEEMGLDNVDVQTYHSFCVRNYDKLCYTDTTINICLKDNKPRKTEFNYDLIVIDEAQDMTPVYYELVCKIIKDMGVIPQLCVLGDRNQSIYAFNDADERFITYANDIFNFDTNRPWDRVQLKTSYRITDNIALFLNKCAFNYERMKAVKDGKKVKYIMYNPFGNPRYSYPFRELKKIFRKYKYEDIFVLAPSVRSKKSPIRKLANILSEDGFPIYVPSDTDKELDNEVIKNKIVFSTYHQTKGLERKVVIVYGCDASYFKYYKKNANPMKCPNEIYVAWTRAKELLYVLHSNQADYLPFLVKSNIGRYAEVKMEGLFKGKGDDTDADFVTDVPVTDLTRHLSTKVISKVTEYLDYTQIKECGKKIKIPIKTKQNNLVEGVSDITGTAIPAYSEYLLTGKMTIFDNIKKYIKGNHNLCDLDLNDLTPEKLLEITNNYQAITSGYIYRVNQITNYSWLSKNNLDECTKRLNEKISNETVFEKRVHLEAKRRKIVGYIDAIDNGIVYEFKCVKELSDDHFIQLAIYAYLYEKEMVRTLEEGTEIEFKGKNGKIIKIYETGDVDIEFDDKKVSKIRDIRVSDNRYILYNILTDETWELNINMPKLGRMLEYLIDEKYSDKKKDDDSKFLNKVNSIREKYFNGDVENQIGDQIEDLVEDLVIE